MDVVFGCDHNAEPQMATLYRSLSEFRNVIDVSECSEHRDYVSVTKLVCQKVLLGNIGVLICGTGIGVSVVANKYKGIIAARCLTPEDAEDSRLINHANILCLSAKVSENTNIKIIDAFLSTTCSKSSLRLHRLRQLAELERNNFL